MFEASLQADRAPQQDASRTLLQEAIHAGTGIFVKQESPLRNEVEHYAGELAKTVPLFLIGSKSSYAASAVMYGLDQARVGDETKTQVLDFGLGATKGALLKGSFEAVGSQNWGIAAKGVGLGVSSRVLDLGLTRQTYLDQAGNFSLMTGAERTLTASLNPKALAADVLIFGAAHGMFKGLNAASAGAFERSPLMRTVGTGGTFGFVAGAGGEMQRQHDAREEFDPFKVLMRGSLQAGVTAIGAIPGGMQQARRFDMTTVRMDQLTGPDNAKPTLLLESTPAARALAPELTTAPGRAGAPEKAAEPKILSFNARERIGEGDQGVVYDNGNRTVTKVFKEPIDVEAQRAMYDRLAGIGVNVPKVLETGVTASGKPAMVFEKIGDGENVRNQVMLSMLSPAERRVLNSEYYKMADTLHKNGLTVDWNLKNMILTDGKLYLVDPSFLKEMPLNPGIVELFGRSIGPRN